MCNTISCLNFVRVCNTVCLNWLPLWTDWWMPWSSVTRTEDPWFMRHSCIMGLWPNGSAPVKRLVAWTLSRLAPMSIFSIFMEEDAWSWNSVSVYTPNYWTIGFRNLVSSCLQVSKLLCTIFYWSNSFKSLYNVDHPWSQQCWEYSWSCLNFWMCGHPGVGTIHNPHLESPTVSLLPSSMFIHYCLACTDI